MFFFRCVSCFFIFLAPMLNVTSAFAENYQFVIIPPSSPKKAPFVPVQVNGYIYNKQLIRSAVDEARMLKGKGLESITVLIKTCTEINVFIECEKAIDRFIVFHGPQSKSLDLLFRSSKVEMASIQKLKISSRGKNNKSYDKIELKTAEKQINFIFSELANAVIDNSPAAQAERMVQESGGEMCILDAFNAVTGGRSNATTFDFDF